MLQEESNKNNITVEVEKEEQKSSAKYIEKERKTK